MGVQSFYTTFPEQTVVVHDYSVMCLHALTHIHKDTNVNIFIKLNFTWLAKMYEKSLKKECILFIMVKCQFLALHLDKHNILYNSIEISIISLIQRVFYIF